MRRKFLISLLLAGACVAGVAGAELILHSPHFRDALGILYGRGHLLAIAQGEGIYGADLWRALAELRYAAGVGEKEHDEGEAEKRRILTRMIADSTARSLAAHENVAKARIDGKLNSLCWQFPNEKTQRIAFASSGLSIGSLRRSIADDLRAQQWIAQRISSQINATEDECRKVYDAHRDSFMQPMRFRASHLFVAAPPVMPPEDAETKQQAIKSFAERIKQGETLAELAAVESEDEATKNRSGDLGFFSQARMPSDFSAAVAKMRVGEISQPIRTRLGFHIIQLTDAKPARQMSFEEARAEIRLMIENAKRRLAVESLVADLSGRAEWLRQSESLSR